MKRLLLGVLLTLVLANLRCAVVTRSCTLVGCQSGAELQAGVVHVATPDLTKVVITACKNGRCASGVPSVERQPCGAGVSGCPASASCSLTGPLAASPGAVDCILYPSGAADLTTDTQRFAAYTLSIRFNAFDNAARDALTNGDTYTARVVSGGTVLLDVERTATYTQTYPNGVDCDGANGYCRFASLR